MLSLAETGSAFLLRVADTSRTRPVVRAAAPGDTGGRGLLLVEAPADRWGCDPGPAGKTVWVAFEDTLPMNDCARREPRA